MKKPRYVVRLATQADIPSVIEISKVVYTPDSAWKEQQLASHQKMFPEGQFVVEDTQDRAVIGFAASLIVRWDDYDSSAPWRDFTDGGYFTNHNPRDGRTLYGAEIIVHPLRQRTGVGGLIYNAREDLTRKLGLLRIRAGARLRSYHKYAKQMSAADYVHAVIDGKLKDATLSFQLSRGFNVLSVISGYLKLDPESLGYAAIIEWLNEAVAAPEDYRHLHESEFYKAGLDSTHSGPKKVK